MIKTTKFINKKRQTIYVSSDGRCFSDVFKCLDHECRAKRSKLEADIAKIMLKYNQGDNTVFTTCHKSTPRKSYSVDGRTLIYDICDNIDKEVLDKMLAAVKSELGLDAVIVDSRIGHVCPVRGKINELWFYNSSNKEAVYIHTPSSRFNRRIS